MLLIVVAAGHQLQDPVEETPGAPEQVDFNDLHRQAEVVDDFSGYNLKKDLNFLLTYEV